MFVALAFVALIGGGAMTTVALSGEETSVSTEGFIISDSCDAETTKE